jgi:hypothetical protein
LSLQATINAKPNDPMKFKVDLFKKAGSVTGISKHQFASLQEALTFTHSVLAKPHRHITAISITHKNQEVFYFQPTQACAA